MNKNKKKIYNKQIFNMNSKEINKQQFHNMMTSIYDENLQYIPVSKRCIFETNLNICSDSYSDNVKKIIELLSLYGVIPTKWYEEVFD